MKEALQLRQAKTMLVPGESRVKKTSNGRGGQHIARHVHVGLHDPKSGRLDARRIAAYLQISLSSLAPATGRSVAGIHKAPAAESLQQAMAPVARTISLLSEILQSKEYVRTWLRSPHPDLGNQIPMKLILDGHAVAVADMLAAALAGQPS